MADGHWNVQSCTSLLLAHSFLSMCQHSCFSEHLVIRFRKLNRHTNNPRGKKNQFSASLVPWTNLLWNEVSARASRWTDRSRSSLTSTRKPLGQPSSDIKPWAPRLNWGKMYSQSVFEACDFFFKEQLEWLKTYLFVCSFFPTKWTCWFNESCYLPTSLVFHMVDSFMWMNYAFHVFAEVTALNRLHFQGKPVVDQLVLWFGVMLYACASLHTSLRVLFFETPVPLIRLSCIITSNSTEIIKIEPS